MQLAIHQAETQTTGKTPSPSTDNQSYIQPKRMQRVIIHPAQPQATSSKSISSHTSTCPAYLCRQMYTDPSAASRVDSASYLVPARVMIEIHVYFNWRTMLWHWTSASFLLPHSVDCPRNPSVVAHPAHTLLTSFRPPGAQCVVQLRGRWWIPPSNISGRR